MIGLISKDPSASPNAVVSMNGQCGVPNNGDVCGSWHLGRLLLHGWVHKTTSVALENRYTPGVAGIPTGILYALDVAHHQEPPFYATSYSLKRYISRRVNHVTSARQSSAIPYVPIHYFFLSGDLFTFVSQSSETLSISQRKAVKTLPYIPGDYKTYPNTGGSVLLPLSSDNERAPSTIICGGGAYQDITSHTDLSSGRINPLDGNPQREMDAMV
jgi:hypothetical protein